MSEAFRGAANVPEIKLPLDEFVRRIAQDAGRAGAREVLKEHQDGCPLRGVLAPLPARVDGVEMRVQRIELRLATLIGFMIGSGLLGGAAGAALVKVW